MMQCPLGTIEFRYTRPLWPNKLHKCNNDDISKDSGRINKRTGECMNGQKARSTTVKRRIKR